MEVGDPLIKNNQQLLNGIHVVLDAVVMVIAYMLAWFFRFRSGFFALDAWYLSLQAYMRALIFVVPGYLILYYVFQLYTPKRYSDIFAEDSEEWIESEADPADRLQPCSGRVY